MRETKRIFAACKMEKTTRSENRSLSAEARQVGKTWLMKEFGQSCYESYVYFNFDEEDELKSIFEANKNPQRIIELLSMIAGEKILPGETLVIFDEVQECPEGAEHPQILQRGKRTSTMSLQPEVCLAPCLPSQSPIP